MTMVTVTTMMMTMMMTKVIITKQNYDNDYQNTMFSRINAQNVYNISQILNGTFIRDQNLIQNEVYSKHNIFEDLHRVSITEGCFKELGYYLEKMC